MAAVQLFDGLIWSEVLKNTKGEPIPMSYAQAEKACKKLDARLPSFKEVEWSFDVAMSMSFDSKGGNIISHRMPAWLTLR